MKIMGYRVEPDNGGTFLVAKILKKGEGTPRYPKGMSGALNLIRRELHAVDEPTISKYIKKIEQIDKQFISELKNLGY